VRCGGLTSVDPRAVDAARIEYQRAGQSAATIRVSNDFAEIQTAWASFLVHAGRIFTKLEQGSKDDNQSKAWWGKKLHERRTDPLLCYLWHARNADEHTLQQITEMKEASAKNVESTQSDIDKLNRAMASEKRPFIPLGLVEVVWAHVKMLDVTDRGISYPAPGSHLGIQITDTSPANIVNLSLAFFDSTIAEAAELT
jgi:hypothetical protein